MVGSETLARGGGDRRPVDRARSRRVLRCVGVGALVLTVLMGGYLAVVATRRQQTRVLPLLTGSHAVGRTAIQLTTASVDPLAPRLGRREVSVWIWYPASVAVSGRVHPAQYAPDLWSGLHLRGVVGLGEGAFDAIRTRAVQEAPVEAGSFGLVVLQPGMGFAGPQYQAIAEDVASAGFVVAAVTPTRSANLTVIDGKVVRSTAVGNPPDLGGHRGRAEADADRLVQIWATDAIATARALHHAAVPALADRLRRGTVYLGHSFGGAAALQACSLDHGCRGAVDLDGTQFGTVLRAGIRHPLLLLGSDDSCITGRCPPAAATNHDDVTAARKLLRHIDAATTCLIISGAHHFNFTDYGDYYLAEPLRRFLGLGPIDGARALTVTAAVVAGFANQAFGAGAGGLRVPDGFAHPDAYREIIPEHCPS